MQILPENLRGITGVDVPFSNTHTRGAEGVGDDEGMYRTGTVEGEGRGMSLQ